MNNSTIGNLITKLNVKAAILQAFKITHFVLLTVNSRLIILPHKTTHNKNQNKIIQQ